MLPSNFDTQKGASPQKESILSKDDVIKMLTQQNYILQQVIVEKQGLKEELEQVKQQVKSFTEFNQPKSTKSSRIKQKIQTQEDCEVDELETTEENDIEEEGTLGQEITPR